MAVLSEQTPEAAEDTSKQQDVANKLEDKFAKAFALFTTWRETNSHSKPLQKIFQELMWSLQFVPESNEVQVVQLWFDLMELMRLTHSHEIREWTYEILVEFTTMRHLVELVAGFNGFRALELEYFDPDSSHITVSSRANVIIETMLVRIALCICPKFPEFAADILLEHKVAQMISRVIANEALSHDFRKEVSRRYLQLCESIKKAERDGSAPAKHRRVNQLRDPKRYDIFVRQREHRRSCKLSEEARREAQELQKSLPVNTAIARAPVQNVGPERFWEQPTRMQVPSRPAQSWDLQRQRLQQTQQQIWQSQHQQSNLRALKAQFLPTRGYPSQPSHTRRSHEALNLWKQKVPEIPRTPWLTQPNEAPRVAVPQPPHQALGDFFATSYPRWSTADDETTSLRDSPLQSSDSSSDGDADASKGTDSEAEAMQSSPQASVATHDSGEPSIPSFEETPKPTASSGQESLAVSEADESDSGEPREALESELRMLLSALAIVEARRTKPEARSREREHDQNPVPAPGTRRLEIFTSLTENPTPVGEIYENPTPVGEIYENPTPVGEIYEDGPQEGLRNDRDDISALLQWLQYNQAQKRRSMAERCDPDPEKKQRLDAEVSPTKASAPQAAALPEQAASQEHLQVSQAQQQEQTDLQKMMRQSEEPRMSPRAATSSALQPEVWQLPCAELVRMEVELGRFSLTPEQKRILFDE